MLASLIRRALRHPRLIAAAAFLFLFGLQRMSSPATAPSGIFVAGLGMIAAIVASFLYVFSVGEAARPHLGVNIALALVALMVGGEDLNKLNL